MEVTARKGKVRFKAEGEREEYLLVGRMMEKVKSAWECR